MSGVGTWESLTGPLADAGGPVWRAHLDCGHHREFTKAEMAGFDGSLLAQEEIPCRVCEPGEVEHREASKLHT